MTATQLPTPSPATGAAALRSGALRLAAAVVARLEQDRLAAAVALVAGVVTFWIFAFHQHAPYDIRPGAVAGALAWASPGVAAPVAALSVLAPWPGLLAVLLLTPYWDAAQVSWQAGSVQVIPQTVFLTVLLLGWWLARGRPARAAGGLRAGFRPVRQMWLVPGGLLGLTILSTLLSPSWGDSAPVALHGVAEPMGFAALLLLLRPARRDLLRLLLVLGVSVSLGALLNLVQSLPTFPSLASLQYWRLLFSRLTYFNAGLFGELLAMTIPLLVGAVAARRRLGLGRGLVALLLTALGVSLLGLFLSFSKSGWLATGIAMLLVLVLLAPGWRRRVAIVGLAIVVSGIVVPWPAAVLRPLAPGAADAYDAFMVGLVGQSRFESWDPATLPGQGSILERWYATEAALHMALDHPLLGVGLDRFKDEYAGAYHTPQARLYVDSSHDLWPNVAAELGLPALALLVLVFAAGLWSAWRARRRDDDDVGRTLGTLLVAALVAWVVVATTFDPDLYRTWRNMASDIVFAAVIVAAAWAVGHQPRASGPAPADGRPSPEATA